MSSLLVLALLSIGWCVLHSLLIAAPILRAMRRSGGVWARFHRLLFNVVSVVTLLGLLRYRASVVGDAVFAWEGWLVVPWALMLAAAISFFLAGGRHYDLMQFLGVRQLMGGSAGPGLKEGGALDTSGILGYVRHPWYSGALLIIWARPLDASDIVMNVVFSLYLVLGTVIEERKLVAEFGEEYLAYQRDVPMLLPGIGRRRFGAR